MYFKPLYWTHRRCSGIAHNAYKHRWSYKCFRVVTNVLFLKKNTEDLRKSSNHPVYDLHDDDVVNALFVNNNINDYSYDLPVYDLHDDDVVNALFVNNNINDYSYDFHFCAHFFNPVINIRFSKNTSTR